MAYTRNAWKQKFLRQIQLGARGINEDLPRNGSKVGTGGFPLIQRRDKQT
jgi:hypothetical protein